MSPALVDAIMLGVFGYVVWIGQVRPSVWRARVAHRKRKIDRFGVTPIAESRQGTVVKIVGRVEAVGELVEGSADRGFRSRESHLPRRRRAPQRCCDIVRAR